MHSVGTGLDRVYLFIEKHVSVAKEHTSITDTIGVSTVSQSPSMLPSLSPPELARQ